MSDPIVTLVLLPGLHGTEALFKPLILSTQDNIGVQAISYPTDEPLSYQQLALIVEKEIESIETPIVLLGESFSGPLALIIANKGLKNLIGVILVGTFVTTPNLRIFKFLPWALIFTLVKFVFKLFVGLIRKYPESVLISAMIEVRKNKSSVLAQRVAAAYEIDARGELKQCPVPLAYFRGNRDFVVPAWNLKQIAAIRPDTGVSQFNTSHAILQMQPAQAWRAIFRFVERVKGTGDGGNV